MNGGIDLNDLPGAHGGRERAHRKPVRKEGKVPQFDGFNARPRPVRDRVNHDQWGQRFAQPPQHRVAPVFEGTWKSEILGTLALLLGAAAILIGLAYVGILVYEHIIEPVFTFIFDVLDTLVNIVLEAIQFVVDIVSAIGEAIEYVINGIGAIVSFIFEVIYVLIWAIIGFILLPFWFLYEVGSYIMEVVDLFLSGLAWLFGA